MQDPNDDDPEFFYMRVILVTMTVLIVALLWFDATGFVTFGR